MRPLPISRQRALVARISRAGKRTQTTPCLQGGSLGAIYGEQRERAMQGIASLLIREGADGSFQQTTACLQGIASLLICEGAAGRERRRP